MKGDNSSEDVILTKIKQLRSRIPDIIEKDKKFNDDFYLHRWLLSRQCKVDRTAASIREAVLWRAKVNFDQFTGKEWSSCPPDLAQELPVTMNSHSKNGQPVITFNCNDLDIRASIQKFGKKTAILYLTEMLAKVETVMLEHYRVNDLKKTEQYKPQFPAVIVIGTFRNYSIWNASSFEVAQTFVEAANNGVKYFPCMASSIYLVNFNKFAAMVFKLIKPILSGQPYTVGCYDTDRTNWPLELQELAQDFPFLNSTEEADAEK